MGPWFEGGRSPLPYCAVAAPAVLMVGRALALLVCAIPAASSPLSVSVSAAGSYVVEVDGVPWLGSGGPPDHLGRNLTVLSRNSSAGEDEHGAYKAVTLRWQLAGRGGQAVLVTEFKTCILRCNY